MTILDGAKGIFLMSIVLLALSFYSGCANSSIGSDKKTITGNGTNNEIKAPILKKEGDAGRDSNQTANTGFMSGGAPWLFMVVALMLYGQKTTALSRKNKEHEKSKIEVQGLTEQVGTLKKHNSDLKVQAFEKALNKKAEWKNEEE